MGVGFFYASKELGHATVESYNKTEISYDRCYWQQVYREQFIVLENNAEKYRMAGYLWAGYEAESIIALLRQQNNCTVWLDAKEDHQVRGIAAKDLYIDPIVSVEWDQHDKKLFTICSIIFTLLGLFGIADFASCRFRT